mgnify:CR=1 FL=1
MEHKNHIMHKEKEIEHHSHHHAGHSHHQLKKEAEKLYVNCGCEIEAKQYEYNLKKSENAGHEMHKENDMSKISHQDHEVAMTNPVMAKEMETDMWRRFLMFPQEIRLL